MIRNNQKSPLALVEEQRIRQALKAHPILLLNGSAGIGVRRALDALVAEYVPNKKDEATAIYINRHPDLTFVDGRELKVDEARELRSAATTNPARWPKKFLVISHLERPHPSVLPVLLKVIEEPPARFSVILATNNPASIPQTIPSRSIQIKIATPIRAELEALLEEFKVEEAAWRAGVCGGDIDTALGLDTLITRNWHKLWSGMLVGAGLSTDFITLWIEIFNEASEDTQVSCWEILVDIASRKVHKSIYWREIAFRALSLRDISRKGWANKVLVSNFIVQCYAYAKTITKRER